MLYMNAVGYCPRLKPCYCSQRLRDASHWRGTACNVSFCTYGQCNWWEIHERSRWLNLHANFCCGLPRNSWTEFFLRDRMKTHGGVLGKWVAVECLAAIRVEWQLWYWMNDVWIIRKVAWSVGWIEIKLAKLRCTSSN